MKTVKIAALALVVVYLAACSYLYLQQQSLVFNPGTADVAEAVQQVPRAENVTLTAPDGLALKAWWVAPADGKPVYLYFHGNAGNLQGSFGDPSGRAERFEGLTRAGAGLLAVSWRGYGGSPGEPSEQGLKMDADTALAWLRRQAPSAAILLFGESLGTGIAVEMAARESLAALILDSPYTSITDIGALRYPWLPVRLLAKYPFESLQHAGAVTEPVLIQHCSEDDTVPYAQGRSIFAGLGSSEKLFVTVAGRCHVPSIIGQLPLLRELEERFSRS